MVISEVQCQIPLTCVGFVLALLSIIGAVFTLCAIWCHTIVNLIVQYDIRCGYACGLVSSDYESLDLFIVPRFIGFIGTDTVIGVGYFLCFIEAIVYIFDTSDDCLVDVGFLEDFASLGFVTVVILGYLFYQTFILVCGGINLSKAYLDAVDTIFR